MQLPFLNPWLLWALPAVGVPILIHLLNRHRATTIEWGAMELLRKVMVYRSRQIRLEDILLMIVRCVIVLLLVLAVARMTTRALPVAGQRNAGVVVAIDSSLSMLHQPATRSRFDEALERARTILRTVDLGQPVSIVMLGQRPKVLLRTSAYDPATVDAALAQARATYEPLNLDAGLEELQALAGELKAAEREVHLITDAHATSFGQLSAKTKTALRDIAALGVKPYIVTVPCASEENASVSQLDLASGVLRVGALAQFQATVKNHGRSARPGGPITLLLNDQPVDRRSVDRLMPGQATTVRFTAMLNQPGVNRLTARLDDDAFPGDDRCHAVINVRSSLRVLCVDGDPLERPESRMAGWVTTALAPTTFDRSEARPIVDTIPWTTLAAARLHDYDAVVLVNVADVNAERAIALRKFVEQGGGLILVPGGNSKLELLNRRFLDAESSLLPGEAVGLVEDAQITHAGVPLDVELAAHPLVTPLRSLPREILTEVRCYRYLQVRAGTDTRTVLSLGNAAPLLLERNVGRGRVLLWTSGIGGKWNNLPLNPAFPILLQQAITYMTRQPFETPVTVPGPILLPLPLLSPDAQIEVQDPAGSKAVTRTVLRGGEVVLESAPTTLPGFHTLAMGAEAGTLALAANVDPASSDMKVLNAPALQGALENLPVRVLGPERELTTAVLEGRQGRELWVPLLVAVLALLAVEILLARKYTKRA